MRVPTSLRNSYESESERTLQGSDDDVLREEEDAERLLYRSKTGFAALFKRNDDHDPNQPREVKQSRKDRKRQRRRERKAKRRRGKGEDEASLMYNMEEGGELNTSDETSSTSSEELSTEKSPKSHALRKKLLHFGIIPIALIALFGLFGFGAYQMTRKDRKSNGHGKSLKSNGTHTFAPTTILVSLDGFRADFLTRGLTPTLNQFIQEGVSPRYMLPSFPSVTFPNHFTLVTGLYPESHGVVGNQFWDPDLEEEFINTVPEKSMFPKWWTASGAEAVWSTAERQGVRTGIHMWPGSEAGLLPLPTYVDKYNGSELLSRKVERVFNFLDRSSELDEPGIKYTEGRPQFIALYVPDVDSDGHKYGPNSTEIRGTIQNADTMLHDMLEGLAQRNLTDIVNVIVVSDHGMATTSNDRLIQLEDLVDMNDIKRIDGWPLYGLWPKEDRVDIGELYKKLKDEAAKHGHFEVYLRDNMPKRWHFSKSHRIAPLWIIPETGWAVVHYEDFNVKAAQKDGTIYHPRGLHGYDHEHPLMRAIFIARGPAFSHTPNSRLEVLQNIELYNILCDSLGIQPNPNNGTLRLPFKPIGLHSDEKEEEVPVDLPSSSGGTSMVRTKTTAAEATSTPSQSSAAQNSTGKAANIETHQEHGIWEKLINKIKEGFHRISDLVKGQGKKKENDEADQ